MLGYVLQSGWPWYLHAIEDGFVNAGLCLDVCSDTWQDAGLRVLNPDLDPLSKATKVQKCKSTQKHSTLLACVTHSNPGVSDSTTGASRGSILCIAIAIAMLSSPSFAAYPTLLPFSQPMDLPAQKNHVWQQIQW